MTVLAILLLASIVNAFIGAALGSTIDRIGMGILLGLILGPVGWIILFLMPRDQSVADGSASSGSDFRHNYISTDLSDDAYKIWLGKTFEITRNDLFEKYECDNTLFDTLEEALEHADSLNQSRRPPRPGVQRSTASKLENGRHDNVLIIGGLLVWALVSIAAVVSIVAN
jgi:hypothetical protein